MKTKKWQRLGSFLLSIGMVASAATSMVACRGGNEGGGSDAENVLDIYLLYKGYGDAWLRGAMNNFKKQDWVKQKYPNLTINYTFDANDTTPYNKLKSGKNINKFDLMFGVNLQELEDTGLLADLTDSVYLTEVPGEKGTRVIDKIPQETLDLVYRKNAPMRADGEDTYHVVAYIDSTYGMLYNADILEELNLPMPVTTDQFLSVGDQIKEKKYDSALGKDESVVIMNAAQDNYWKYSYEIFWTQYEGLEGYKNYFDGYDEVDMLYDSKTVLNQKGRLRALEVIESIISGYSYESSWNVDYKAAQTSFLSGRGVFHFNGDYFVSEMQLEVEALKKNGIDYDIRWMKMPVVSSIIEKTPTIQDDQALQEVILEIDADKTYDESQAKTKGVSKADFDTVAAARMVGGFRASATQSAVIPSYAGAKDLAADFLRYMYTNEAIQNFTADSRGILFPSTFNLFESEFVMNSVHPIEKTKFEMLAGTSNYSFTSLPNPSGTRLGKVGLTSLYFNGTFEGMFIQPLENRMRPADILETEQSYWSNTAWDQMTSRAK